MSLQKQITDEMAKLAYAIINYTSKLNPEADIRYFKRMAAMRKAYKDLERLLKLANTVEH